MPRLATGRGSRSIITVTAPNARTTSARSRGIIPRPHKAFRAPQTTLVPILVTTITRPGTGQATQVTGDPWNNHLFVNDGRTFLEIVNTSAVSQTVTILPAHNLTLDALTPQPEVRTVAPGATLYIGSYTINTFKQDTLNDMYVNVSSTGLLLRAYKLP